MRALLEEYPLVIMWPQALLGLCPALSLMLCIQQLKGQSSCNCLGPLYKDPAVSILLHTMHFCLIFFLPLKFSVHSSIPYYSYATWQGKKAFSSGCAPSTRLLDGVGGFIRRVKLYCLVSLLFLIMSILSQWSTYPSEGRPASGLFRLNKTIQIFFFPKML